MLVVAYLIFDILHLSGPRRIRDTITTWLRTPRPGCCYNYLWSSNGLQVSTDMASKAFLERKKYTAVSDTAPVRYKIAHLEENGGPSANVDPSQQQIPPLDDKPASPLQHASKLLHDMNADVQLNYKNVEHLSDIHSRNGAMSTRPPDGRHAGTPTPRAMTASLQPDRSLQDLMSSNPRNQSADRKESRRDRSQEKLPMHCGEKASSGGLSTSSSGGFRESGGSHLLSAGSSSSMGYSIGVDPFERNGWFRILFQQMSQCSFYTPLLLFQITIRSKFLCLGHSQYQSHVNARVRACSSDT